MNCPSRRTGRTRCQRARPRRRIRLTIATLGAILVTAACTATLTTSPTTGTTTTTTFPHRGPASGGTIPETTVYLPPSIASKLSEVPVTTGPGKSTSDVTVLHPDPATLMALGAAAAYYEAVINCVVDTVPGTIHLARINSIGVLVAIAGVEPSPSCIANFRSNPRGLDTLKRNPPPLVGVFSQEPGKSWIMLSDAGTPFPCQATPVFPAQYTPEVLKAWQIPYYSPNCQAFFEPAPA
jgi:hypothetical protein